MTKVGTGYVSIEPDLSGFGRGLDAQITQALRGVGRSAGESIGRDLTRTISRSTKARVSVDVDRNSLSRMSAAIAGVGAAAFASLAASAGSAFQAIGAAAGGIGGAISAGIGALGAIGPVLKGAAIVLGVLLLPAAIALGASLLSAAAGAAALGVALAAAFGPVVLVGVAILARVVAIVKATGAANKASESAAKGNAAALDGVASAMDGLASAQAGVASAQEGVASASRAVAAAQRNVREQATAAYRAFGDAVEAVKDDILDLQAAQNNISSAKLSTREAQQALKDFQAEAGATTGALDAVFEKFSDVAVDSSGLASAIQSASAGSGVSEDDQLRLERLVLNVRDAKLNEKRADDSLSDASGKLTADRKVEADFLKRGITAYKPYRDALDQTAEAQRGVASAQRGLNSAQRGVASAQRGVAAAVRASNTELTDRKAALKDLTPTERKFGELLKATGDAIKAVFTPAVAAAFGGITKGIESGLEFLKDPKIGASLTTIGTAIGEVAENFGKALNTQGAKDLFVKLAAGGAELVRVLGSRVFIDVMKILGRIAESALPLLLSGVEKLGGVFDGLEKATRSPEKMQEVIDGLVETFKDWLRLGYQVGRVIMGVFKAALPAGNGLLDSLTDTARAFADFLGTTKGQARIKKFFADAAEFAKAVGTAVLVAIPIVKGLIDAFKFVAKHIETIGIAIVAVAAYFVVPFLPLIATVAAIVAAVVAAVYIIDHFGEITRKVGELASAAFGAVKSAVGDALDAVVTFVTGIPERIGGLVSGIAGVFTDAFKAVASLVAWYVRTYVQIVTSIPGRIADGVGRIAGVFRGVFTTITTAITNTFNAFVQIIGGVPARIFNRVRAIGTGIKDGIMAGLGGMSALAETIVNGLIDIFNRGLRLINSGTPGEIKVLGKVIVPAIPDIPLIAHLATGGRVPGYGSADTVPALLTPGEYVIRKAAVRAIGFDKLEELNAHGGARMMQAPARAPRYATGGPVLAAASAGTQIGSVTVPITVAGGGYPDVTDLRVRLARAVERVGGDPRQD